MSFTQADIAGLEKDAESQAEVDKMVASVDASGVKNYLEANPAQ